LGRDRRSSNDFLNFENGLVELYLIGWHLEGEVGWLFSNKRPIYF